MSGRIWFSALATVAVAMPWYAIFTGNYALYFFLLLAGAQAPGVAGDMLFILLIALTIPLALAMLFLLPALTLWTTVRWKRPHHWIRLTEATCLGLVALFSALYGGGLALVLLIEGKAAWLGVVGVLNALALCLGAAASFTAMLILLRLPGR